MARFLDSLPQASLATAIFSALAVLPILGPPDMASLPIFGVSAALALIAFGLGLAGLLRPHHRSYALAGLLLSLGVLLFWCFLLLCAALIAMTALP